jgi:hypothetical protein
MIYAQGGADFTNKKPTKAALKLAIKEAPHTVYLYDTAAMKEWQKFSGYADQLPEDITFNVVGPDPFTDRSWYASIYRNAKGGLTVK